MLEAPPPRFTAEEIAAIAAELFGLRGVATDLGSERDQTFLIDDGAAGGVMKISNLGEDPAVLDLETKAILHVSRVDPELPVALPRPSVHGDYRPTFEGPDGTHFVRLFERLRGHAGAARRNGLAPGAGHRARQRAEADPFWSGGHGLDDGTLDGAGWAGAPRLDFGHPGRRCRRQRPGVGHPVGLADLAAAPALAGTSAYRTGRMAGSARAGTSALPCRRRGASPVRPASPR